MTDGLCRQFFAVFSVVDVKTQFVCTVPHVSIAKLHFM